MEIPMIDKATVAHKVAETVATPMIAGENIVYLMGLSFIIGCLFTVLMLIVLDFMRRNTMKRSDDRRAS
jgi:hypothetical protein